MKTIKLQTKKIICFHFKKYLSKHMNITKNKIFALFLFRANFVILRTECYR